MPQVKNQTRWEPPAKAKLRKGQRALYECVSTNIKNQYLIELPTGYGKSWCACIAYAVLKAQGRVDRCLIIVPNDQQRTQYYTGLQEDLAFLKVPYRGIERCVNGYSWVVKKSFRNESDIFVAGISSINADPSYYADLMSKGQWLVIADEAHHYAEGKTWGDAVSGLQYEALLGMSATPLRRDGSLTIFGDADFDVKVSLREAFKEKAVRPFSAKVIDYTVTYSLLGEDPQTALLSELYEDAEGDVSAYEVKREVRYFTKYISSIFLMVIDKWIEYELICPGQNQILVFAMSCKHAESIAKTINEVAFPGLPEPFADWIGVGKASDKRTPQQNDEILQRFQDNKLPCLVQVNKAGEGFNNKRCSIGLMLDMVGDTPQKRQHIGRFLRVNPDAPETDAVVFISTDHPCRELLENLQEQIPSESTNNEDGQGGDIGSGEKQLKLPDIFIVNTEFHSEKTVYPYGSKENAIHKFLEESPEAAAIVESISPHDGQKLLESLMEQWVKKLIPQPKPLTSEEQRKQISEQVRRCTGTLVHHVLKKRYGKSIPKSAQGDYFKAIHGRWKRQNGGHDSSTQEDLLAKKKWLDELTTAINEGGLPSWLIL
ncbi:MAG: DEAD/DEAH box helicase [bacterium]